MDIVHVDPGYGRGLTVSNGSISCVESDEYNPINGVAFTGIASDSTAPSFSFPNLSYTLPATVSVRFSVYLDLSSGSSLVVSFGSRSKLIISSNQVTMSLIILPNTSVTNTTTLMTGSTKGFHNAAITMSGNYSQTSPFNRYSAVMSCDFDGQGSDSSKSDNISNSSLAQSYIFDSGLRFSVPTSSTDTCYISNIIVSKSSLNSGMLLARLPLNTPPTTDFLSAGDGEYVGTTSGQKLLSAINAGENSDVITKFGATSKVSHIITYGNPGYRVGSNITGATGISQSGNDSITAHGDCSLSTDADAAACVAWEAPEGTKLSDLDGLKVGWQV